jgi:hypothetical protein
MQMTGGGCSGICLSWVGQTGPARVENGPFWTGMSREPAGWKPALRSSWSQCMRTNGRRLSMNQPIHRSVASRALGKRRSSARTPDASRLPGVSEPREASDYRRFPRFMVAMHGRKAVWAFHEPGLVWSPAFRRYARGPDRLKPGLQTDAAEDFLILILLLIDERRVRVRLRVTVRQNRGSWSQCTASESSGLSMNLPRRFGREERAGRGGV